MGLNFLLACNFFFATMVIFCNNVLYAIIGLVCVILGSCFILFSLKIEFLSFILLLIYIGAIIILFLFIAMMLQLNNQELKQNKLPVVSLSNILYIILTIKLMCFLYVFSKKLCVSINLYSQEFTKANELLNVFSNVALMTGNDVSIFFGLFIHKFYFFIVVGIILLFAMVGSIALCVKQ